jgi:hypothetical protein
MLRPLYRCVLRLHPPGFRKRFAGEMLSIFDHTPEKPAAARLLADGLLSLLRQWTLRPESWHEISPARQPARDGVPTFHTLDPFRPRAGAVIHGLVLSTAVFGLTCFAIRYSWIHILHVRIREVQADSARSFQSESGPGADARFEKPTGPLRAANKAPLELPAPSHSALDVPTPARLPASTVHNQNSVTQSSAANQPQAQVHFAAQPALGIAGHPKHGLVADLARSGGLQSDSPQFLERSGLPHLLEPQPKTQDAIRETLPTAIENLSLDAAERERVIHGAVANLTKYYIDRDVAQKMADALMAHEKNGDDDAAADAEVFADLLTRQMAAVSHDPYVIMSYSAVPSADNPRAPTSDDLTRYRKEMKENNCAIETAKILPHNIGYFKFNAFPDTAICAKTVTAAMTSLNHTDAIIFDLRDNRGGYANMVEFLATYLFDHPTHLNDFYDRSENSTEQSWTLPPVPGNRLADKPAFVLTSPTMFSAAEGFAYDLKMSKRATLVGETTSGRGHLGKGHRIDDHFTIRIPGIRVINPISRTNWEGTGVEPDVKVKAADALATAEKLAEKTLPPN